MQILLCGVIVIQVNLRTAHDINSGVPHRWKVHTFPWSVLFLRTICEWASRHLTSFRPRLPSRALRQQELTVCRLINSLSGSLLVRGLGAACLLRLTEVGSSCVKKVFMESDECVLQWRCTQHNFCPVTQEELPCCQA